MINLFIKSIHIFPFFCMLLQRHSFWHHDVQNQSVAGLVDLAFVSVSSPSLQQLPGSLLCKIISLLFPIYPVRTILLSVVSFSRWTPFKKIYAKLIFHLGQIEGVIKLLSVALFLGLAALRYCKYLIARPLPPAVDSSLPLNFRLCSSSFSGCRGRRQLHRGAFFTIKPKLPLGREGHLALNFLPYAYYMNPFRLISVLLLPVSAFSPNGYPILSKFLQKVMLFHDLVDKQQELVFHSKASV